MMKPAFLTTFSALSARERIGIGTALVVVTLFAIIQFVVVPFNQKRDRLNRTIQSKLTALEEMVRLRAEYEEVNRKATVAKARFAKRDKAFTLFSFLDQQSGATGIKQNVAYMKPSSPPQKEGELPKSRVEMKLQSITLKQLTDFLDRVETSENQVFVRKMNLSVSGKKEKRIDATFLMETFLP
jgi:general secretion pathway protein M